MKRHIFGGICQVLFRKKWGDFNYEQRKSLEKSRLRIPRRYYLKREERPLEKLPGEESVAGAEITYQFVFNALYRLSYTFSDPTQITVADRDNALQKFKTEFQNYVDNLSEADLTSSNIKTVLSEKADELENSLSTAKMKLSCEVEIVEVHNAGEEIVNN